MSIRYRDQQGREQVIAGLTPGGDIAYGASTTTSATFTIPAMAADEVQTINITFFNAFEMPDDDYHVEFDRIEDASYLCSVTNRTTTGFDLQIRNVSGAATSATTGSYFAYKLYTVSEATQNAIDIAAIQAAMPAGAGTTNKLVTNSQLTSLENSLDFRLDDIEDAIPATASITNKLVTADDVTRDTTVTENSNHLVTSSGIYTAINNAMADKDTIPTDGSTKAVTSDGIYESENKIWKSNGILGAKNLIPYPYLYGNISVKNIDYIDNGDGSITANGTNSDSSDNAYYPINYSTPEPGTYILTGSTSSTMLLWVQKYNGNKWVSNFGYVYSGQTSLEFTVDYNGYDKIRTLLLVGPGKSVSNETVYPMIRRKDDPNTTWQPYAKTNLELTKEKVETDTFNRLGAKNLLHNTGKTTTNSGVTFTINDDGSVTINGTASSYIGVSLGTTYLKEGNYILSLNEGIQVGLGIRNKAGNGWTMLVSPSPAHGYQKSFTITAEEEGNHYVYIFLESYAQGGSNITAYPMIRLASDTDNTWQPYAMTNQELSTKIGEDENWYDPTDYYTTYGGGLTWNVTKATALCQNILNHFSNSPSTIHRGNITIKNGCTYYGNYIHIKSGNNYVSIIAHTYLEEATYHICQNNGTVTVWKLNLTQITS